MTQINKYNVKVGDVFNVCDITLTVIKITDKTCKTEMVTSFGRRDTFQRTWNQINTNIEFGIYKHIIN